MACLLGKVISYPLEINNVKQTADLVTFTGEIFNGKLDFLCKVDYRIYASNLSINRVVTMMLKPLKKK